MITVMELEATLKKARKSGVLKGSDVLVKSQHTGNLGVMRNTVYVGYIDLDTGEIMTYSTTIRGASAQYIVVDEISAFLEAKEPGRTDEDGKDALYRHMAANEEPYIQRGEGI